ncbi:BLUF domain-containing protein [Aureibaculum sp. A20]|uniref:BLUF domain-containing protein n=1 Tax=Aureibaculum flavum TaxID=2795986 RepID=A0ABS0WQV0_9FLAO|nr:BLUF domain-containing protein [Aureibaculum flavum]MBJ2174360.1 BLUF domain-containing protein [Aureibaculum flavum]
MFQLTYVSKSKSAMNFTDLNNILERAKSKNSTLDITGCLVYHNSRFVQILEGEESEVLQLYEKIKADERHQDVTLLWENNAKRYFGEWNMAFHNPNNDDVKQFVENLILFSDFAEKSSSALLSFWATVRRVLGDGKLTNIESI